MTATVVTCPQPYRGRGRPTVFLAGGITDVWNWQTRAAALLPDGVVAFNPRRASWPIGDPAASAGQIGWEFEHLAAADVVLVWFSWETVHPITLYELGFHAAAGRRLVVGCHPDYPRRTDVVLQLGHARPDVTVRDDLAEVCADAVALLCAGAR